MLNIADRERRILKNKNVLGHTKCLIEELAGQTLRQNLP